MDVVVWNGTTIEKESGFVFGTNLGEARKKLGWTQKQAAEKAGITPSSFSFYENNKKTPPLDIAVRLAKTLNVSLDWLCDMNTGHSSVETLADVVRAVNALTESGLWCYVITNTDDSVITTVTMQSKLLHEYFRKLSKYNDMQNDMDDKDLFSAWNDNYIAKLEKISISDIPATDSQLPEIYR